MRLAVKEIVVIGESDLVDWLRGQLAFGVNNMEISVFWSSVCICINVGVCVGVCLCV